MMDKRHTVALHVGAAVLFFSFASVAAEIPPGAAACSGCHAAKSTVVTPVPGLNGRDAAQIMVAMKEFRMGQRPATVMDRIAKGFTDDEINAIAAWYAAQKD